MARPVIGDDPFRAIAHPVRRRMLDLLRERPRSVAELSQSFKLSSPSISQHLAILRDARLVTARQRGRSLIYNLEPGPLTTLQMWLARYPRRSPQRSRSNRKSSSKP
ncbi:MAG: ArsR family transcriptional regulator [Phycisphaerales bacterium]|nr:MAG: ArsR family transcriptional regulator [Phycisphaerales bacterium]